MLTLTDKFIYNSYSKRLDWKKGGRDGHVELFDISMLKDEIRADCPNSFNYYQIKITLLMFQKGKSIKTLTQSCVNKHQAKIERKSWNKRGCTQNASRHHQTNFPCDLSF